jgi:hypothetical protein
MNLDLKGVAIKLLIGSMWAIPKVIPGVTEAIITMAR